VASLVCRCNLCLFCARICVRVKDRVREGVPLESPSCSGSVQVQVQGQGQGQVRFRVRTYVDLRVMRGSRAGLRVLIATWLHSLHRMGKVSLPILSSIGLRRGRRGSRAGLRVLIDRTVCIPSSQRGGLPPRAQCHWFIRHRRGSAYVDLTTYRRAPVPKNRRSLFNPVHRSRASPVALWPERDPRN
jgi:hypothetical protein